MKLGIASYLSQCTILRCSTNHLMIGDVQLLGGISLSRQEMGDNEWIHSTGSGFLIRLNAVSNPLLMLKNFGLSKPARRLIANHIKTQDIELIHFAAEFDVLSEFPVFDW
ncbi:hypothetical protein Xmau_03786 [Xenorhabdus mauleonii]|uniref:DUF5983 domain-containing protein n=1 Tax=Xenorhabdus mauleonii TaxID=351675 RepID=A0A1I3V792_9GAMM|nr:DUF5983 family protein [Xenorhabdus mauleonii]PHM37570.1 hypothetical protein Xmau_03786 [Xenorhabdus mauleonii]SFJ91010.1 hypothetical protein SAMN05421680_11976 [Xenorhabdus mauleonii]